MTTRLNAGPVDALTPGSMTCVPLDDTTAVAVYNIDGELFATADRCTHAKASLSQGHLEADVVVCPVHFGMFHVPTGKALGFPVTTDVATYEVVVEDGSAYVLMPQVEEDQP